MAQWASFPLSMLHSHKWNSSYALHKPHDQEELQGITHHYILYSNCLFIYFIYQKIVHTIMTQSQTVTDSHKQELTFLCSEVYRTSSHKYIKLAIAKSKVTIFIMQPNDIMMGCRVFRMPFRMAYQIGGSWASPNDLGACRDWIHKNKVSLGHNS